METRYKTEEYQEWSQHQLKEWLKLKVKEEWTMVQMMVVISKIKEKLDK